MCDVRDIFYEGLCQQPHDDDGILFTRFLNILPVCVCVCLSFAHRGISFLYLFILMAAARAVDEMTGKYVLSHKQI